MKLISVYYHVNKYNLSRQVMKPYELQIFEFIYLIMTISVKPGAIIQNNNMEKWFSLFTF